MGDSRAAVGTDRLPWLSDEPVATAKRPTSGLLGWVTVALVLVAAVSYWIGTRTIDQTPLVPPNAPVTSQAPMQAPVYEQVQPVAPPEAQPLREPEVHRVPCLTDGRRGHEA